MGKHLVIGGDGLVGRALREQLERKGISFHYTTRRDVMSEEQAFLDLRNPPAIWPNARDYGVVYIVAAVPKFAECEKNPETWLINVDGPIKIAKLFPKAFKVFISSDAVEWAGSTGYGRQKAHVESFMHTVDAAIVRPTRIEKPYAPVFADFLIEIADTRCAGVARWTWHGKLPVPESEGERIYA